LRRSDRPCGLPLAKAQEPGSGDQAFKLKCLNCRLGDRIARHALLANRG
jgi:hypothetical protein